MKLIDIIDFIKKNDITGYQIAQNTGLTEVGVNKILNGASKNPRKSTIDVLANFLHNNYGFDLRMEKLTYGERLDATLNAKGMTAYKLSVATGLPQSSISNYRKNKSVPNNITNNEIASKLNINPIWLLTGEGDKEPLKVLELEVNEPYVMDVHENKNANKFLKLPNGQYLMTMPLAEYDIQAGFLDHFQDLDFLADMGQHSIIVDRPAQGRYVAFRVKGNSMEDGSDESIKESSIVSCRELQIHHWTSRLRINDFPYWVIYTTESRYPLLKQIINHDIDNCKILCHSLNKAPEYSDFELNLSDVQALFYVVDVSRSINKKLNY